MKIHTLSDKVTYIEKVFGRGYLAPNGKNIEVWCPMCAPTDKKKKKLAIRVEDDANHCWTCGWRSRSMFSLVLKYGTREELEEYKSVYMSSNEANRLERQKNCLIVTEENIRQEIILPSDFRALVSMDGQLDPDHVAVCHYATVERGLSERDLWYYKVGSSNKFKWHRRVIMPSFDAAGNLNYLVGRAIDPKARCRYDAPMVDKSDIIFNEINIDWSKPLVLCEGPFDLVRCTDNTVPLLGSNGINEGTLLFEKIVVNNTPVLLGLDADTLYTKTPYIARKLVSYGIDVKIIDYTPFKKHDPGEMSKAEFIDAMSQAKSFDWLNYIQLKLGRATRTSLSVM